MGDLSCMAEWTRASCRRVHSARNAPFTSAEVLAFVVSTWTAFAVGSASAKASLEFAQYELSDGFKVSRARLKGVPSDLAEVKHRRSLRSLDHGAFLPECTLRRGSAPMIRHLNHRSTPEDLAHVSLIRPRTPIGTGGLSGFEKRAP